MGDSQISSRGKKKGQKRKVKLNKIQTEKNKDKTLRQDTESCILADCSLCPRNCHVDRTAGKTGYCGMDQKVKIARAALHMWEEPCISGTRGSGAVFFTGCNLRCCFCQNRERGFDVSCGLSCSVLWYWKLTFALNAASSAFAVSR